ncbi:hypothetical protein GLOIN_2v1775288 [Rhizophagus irregularis DAOM 181602=DAOM 197198]|uniref:Transposase domain-containing protein n=1 Tax=Rhizophagus irregularis (strain DAOM 181602 / DAOM 197198 / MUCL 43194) TaxID=747089 RepID=A0A2P4Q082_RHIID|nr:hypothetical protein GLOIN_2v1775288 [Rhizophagus irregularis DAOM 181602=DAOM 197198]POG71051.1 hypothetical protein GLOIN_2v1775288 [Rhizophagus irregularis DAOM 181602=DAOM 197198]|eukprot:XP_025177917.1 hypothetical protein GLOIN_2v1775288 [Rhizophagus irregularis DAOM 181602=DAOM 197198]
MDEFQIPSDLGRIPGKIHSGEEFTNFTADQWQIFFTIYLTVLLWEHLSDVDRRILNYFVRICLILVNQILESNLADEAHRSLIEIVKLIENHHGRDKITPNLHLSLHLCDCSSDYRPLYVFWCSLPNSNRKIESELMRRLMFDKQIENIISSGIEVKGLELLNSQRTIGSLSVTDKFLSDGIHRFWLNSQNIKDSQISGKENFPGEFLKPVSHNILLSSEMLNLMVEYYNATYESFGFRRPLVEGLDNDIIIRVKINQFGRCQIGSEVFGSSLSLRHVKSSYVLVKFITDDEDVDTYQGQIQYYFTHVVDFLDGPVKHFLAYVRWYKYANSTNIRYYFSSDEICNIELWNTEFYPISRDCIIPVHHILDFWLAFDFRIWKWTFGEFDLEFKNDQRVEYYGSFEMVSSEYLFRPPSFKSLTSSTSSRLKKISGYGPVDFAIDLLQTAKTVSVTEIWSKGPFLGIWKSENEEFPKRFAFFFRLPCPGRVGFQRLILGYGRNFNDYFFRSSGTWRVVVSSSGFFRYRYLWISLDVNLASNLGLIMDSVPGSQVHFERKFQTTIG